MSRVARRSDRACQQSAVLSARRVLSSVCRMRRCDSTFKTREPPSHHEVRLNLRAPPSHHGSTRPTHKRESSALARTHTFRAPREHQSNSSGWPRGTRHLPSKDHAAARRCAVRGARCAVRSARCVPRAGSSSRYLALIANWAGSRSHRRRRARRRRRRRRPAEAGGRPGRWRRARAGRR